MTKDSHVYSFRAQVGLSNSGLGKFGNGRLGGLEPGMKWQTEGSTAEFDWEVRYQTYYILRLGLLRVCCITLLILIASRL